MYDLNLENSLIEDRLRIGRRVRSGSYTELFLGVDLVSGDPVILKALNVAMRGTPDQELEQRLNEYFCSEAEILERLHHPNIINRLGYGEAADLDGRRFSYLVLEYLPGGDLMTLCRRHPLPLARALDYCRHVCLGLGYAHQHGVIHRDIKPQNILLDAERRHVKIIDFGIAKVLRGENDEITRGLGTETYSPPECFGQQENPADLTPAADIYGLAKTLYVLVTGESPREFFQRPVTQFPAEVMVQSWAPDLLRIINKATQHDPPDRYPTVDDFWRDLEPWAQASEARQVSDADEETVMAVGLGQPRPLGSAYQRELPSAVRVEVPIDQSLAEEAALSQKTESTAREPLTEPAQKTPAAPILQTWVRRLTTAVLAASFIASSFWIDSVISGRAGGNLQGKVTAQNLNFRAEPDKASPPFGWIPEGMAVRIIGLSQDGQWFEVEAKYWDGQRWRQGHGWVSKPYVKLLEEQAR
jgi:serine/threonine protein kinase